MSMTDNDNRRQSGMRVLMVAVLFLVAWFMRHALLLIYVSIVFAVAFAPAVDWIQRRCIGRWSPGRGAALLVLIAVVLLAISAFGAFAWPPIVHQTQSLAQEAPDNILQLTSRVRDLPFGDKLAGYFNGETLRHVLRSVSATALKAVQGVTGAVTALLSIALLTAYFILEGRRSFEWALRLAPPGRQPRLRRTSLAARDSVQSWLAGQVILMGILGGSTTIVLGLLGVRYFYALGIFAGLANFVPVLGPIATVILAGAVAALDSWMKLLGVLIFYFVYQQVENAYLTPKIVGSAVGLPGVAVIAALIIGAEIAGVVGAVVAVPTAVIVATFVGEYLSHERESDTEETVLAA